MTFVNTIPYQPMGYESITVSTVSISPTAATIAPSGAPPAVYAYATVETNPIRYRVDGPAPTASEGHPAAVGSGFEVPSQQAVQNLKMIRSGAADGTVKLTYYRPLQ